MSPVLARSMSKKNLIKRHKFMSEHKITQILAQLANHEARLKRLEVGARSVVSKKNENSARNDHSGPKGGTLLLIEEGLFRKKQSVDSVKDALEKKGYVYHKDVVRNTLNRLSAVRGPLAAIKENKSKVYVERK